MTYNETALAKHRLQQSYQALADAELLLKNGTPSGAVAMALRAARQAAEAALIAAGNEALRNESLLFLVLGFVKDGRLSASSFNAFRTMMDLCQYVNERDFSAVNRSVVDAAIGNVKYFLREMGGIVKR